MTTTIELSVGATTVDLTDPTGTFHAATSPAMWGAPTVSMDERALIGAPGALITPVTHRPRDIVLPISVQAEDTDALVAALDTLTKLVDPVVAATAGGVDIVVSRDAAERTISTVLVGGHSGLTIAHQTATTARAVFVLRAAWPYWQTTAASVTVSDSTLASPSYTAVDWDETGLDWEAPILWSGNPTWGTTSTVTGDVTAWPKFEIDGPFTTCDIVNLTTSQAIQYTGTVASGQTLEIDTHPHRRMVTVGGAPAYAGLDARSRLWGMEPGDVDWAVVIDGTPGGLYAEWTPNWLSA